MTRTPDSDAIHPIRFLRHTPAMKPVVTRLLRTGHAGMPTNEGFQQAFEQAREAWNEHIPTLTQDRRPEGWAGLKGCVELAAKIATFSHHGRQIFMPGPQLLEMLAHTDLASVRPDDVALPYNAFYVSFASGTGLAFPGEPNEIDGVYVQVYRDTWELVVTCRRTGRSPKSQALWLAYPEPHFYATFVNDGDDATFADKISAAVAEGEIPTVVDPEALDAFRQTVEEVGQEYGIDTRVPDTPLRQRIADFNAAALPVAERALALAINAICYLTTQPGSATIAYPHDAPETLTSEAKAGKTKGQRRRAAARLLDTGYYPIRLLDLDAPRTQGEGVAPSESAADRRAHWRRGHWRRQPYGRGRTNISLKWIRPTFVSGNKPESDKARLYTFDG